MFGPALHMLNVIGASAMIHAIKRWLLKTLRDHGRV